VDKNINIPAKPKENKKKERGKILKSEHLEDITYKEIDGKLDPNEPIYCFCNYVSYGNMVKCDNVKVYLLI
jgi:hypothetical protein